MDSNNLIVSAEGILLHHITELLINQLTLVLGWCYHFDRGDGMEAEWIPIKEAAKLLEISERQVLNRIHTGKLKAIREGRLWLVHSSLSKPDDEAEGFLERSGNEAFRKLEETVEVLKEQVQKKDKQIEKLQSQLERANEALAEGSHRHDTVVMQMTRLLEYHQQPFWRRWRKRKQLPEATLREENQVPPA